VHREDHDSPAALFQNTIRCHSNRPYGNEKKLTLDASERKVCTIAEAAAASNPLVGSSSTRTSGLVTSSIATDTRRRSPPLTDAVPAPPVHKTDHAKNTYKNKKNKKNKLTRADAGAVVG
jgi:hypothetical protein